MLLTDFWFAWLAVMKDTRCKFCSLQTSPLFWPAELQTKDHTQLWCSCLGLGRQECQPSQIFNTWPLYGCQPDTCVRSSFITGTRSQSQTIQLLHTNSGAIRNCQTWPPVYAYFYIYKT